MYRQSRNPQIAFKINHTRKKGGDPLNHKWYVTFRFGRDGNNVPGINFQNSEEGIFADVLINVPTTQKIRHWFRTNPTILRYRTNYIRRWMVKQIEAAHGEPSSLLLWDGVDPSAARRAEDYKISTSLFHRSWR